MKITAQNHSTHKNNTSFKGVNLIQVSKKAFINPEEAEECALHFSDEVNKITKEWPDGVTDLFAKFGLWKLVTKTFSYLEQPLYINLLDIAKENHARISWLEGRSKIPIKPPLSEDYHSFFLYTKSHKNSAADIFDPRNFNKFSDVVQKEGEKLIDENPERAAVIGSEVWVETKMNDLFIKEFEKATQGEPVKQFKIEDLSQLPNIFKQIAY